MPLQILGGLSMQACGICTGSTLELMPRSRGDASSGDLGCRAGESVKEAREADQDNILAEFDLESNHVFDHEDYLKLMDEMQGPVRMAVSLEDLEMPLEDLEMPLEDLEIEASQQDLTKEERDEADILAYAAGLSLKDAVGLWLEDLECMPDAMAMTVPQPIKMGAMAANEQDLMEGVTHGMQPHTESAVIMAFAAGTTAPTAKPTCTAKATRNQLAENVNFEQLAVVCEDSA